jgi:hypothetical protein
MMNPIRRKLMKTRSILWIIGLIIMSGSSPVMAEQEEAEITPASETLEGLDLGAVCELFKESENLEAFEKSLNDPDVGINNLDLDENGEVDFICVTEETSGNAHLILLQAVLGENESQDVATIEIDESEDDTCMQIQGNEAVYGPDYYFIPAEVHIRAWPIITFLYRPGYRPYRSAYTFGFHPKWWKVFAPVPHARYHTRVTVYTKRAGFVVAKTGRVHVTQKITYHPRSSKLVKKTVVHTPSGTRVTRTTKKVDKTHHDKHRR